MTDNCVISTPYYRLEMYVDVNGLKKPNRWGKDRFMFTVRRVPTVTNWADAKLEYKVMPYGFDPWNSIFNNRNLCWKGTGAACAYTIIYYDKWQISSDYEW